MVKILLFCVTALVLTNSCAWAANTIVYVSARTDGLPGSGTQADPFNGSTQPLFDALLKSFGPNTTINLAAGTYPTYGADGFQVKSGWTLQGAGMGQTTIKLMGHASTSTAHFNVDGEDVTNVLITGLTCDGNDQGYNWPAHQAVGGVFLIGSSNTIDHVEVINCYGDQVQGHEQFSILLSGRPQQIVSNLAIENCVTHQYISTANYTNGPNVAYCTDSEITNCTDDGANHAYTATGATFVTISGCTASSKSSWGFYTDTGADSNITIEKNTFDVGLIPVQFNSSGSSDHIKVLDNILRSANPLGTGEAALVLSGRGTDFDISGNVFTYTGTQACGFILNNTESFTDLQVSDNSANTGLTGGGGPVKSVTDVATLSGNKFNLPSVQVAEAEQSLADANGASFTPAPATAVSNPAPTPSPAPTTSSSAGSATPAATSSPSTSGSPAASPSAGSSPSTKNAATSSSPPSTSTASTTSGASKAAANPVAPEGKTSSPGQAVTAAMRLPLGRVRALMLQRVLASWVHQDPSSAAQYVQAMPDSSAKLAALEFVAESWEAIDPISAMNWLTSLPDFPTAARPIASNGRS